MVKGVDFSLPPFQLTVVKSHRNDTNMGPGNTMGGRGFCHLSSYLMEAILCKDQLAPLAGHALDVRKYFNPCLLRNNLLSLLDRKSKSLNGLCVREEG